MFCICSAFLDPVYSLLIYLIHLSGDSRELFLPLLLATHHPRARLRLYPDRRRGRLAAARLVGRIIPDPPIQTTRPKTQVGRSLRAPIGIGAQTQNACVQSPTLFAYLGGLEDAAPT